MPPHCPAAPDHFATRRAFRLHAAALALAAALLLSATESRADEPNAPVIDPGIMSRAAQIAYARELGRAQAKQALDRNSELLRTARRVTDYLILSAPKLLPESAGWAWSIHVETREEPVAWCMPGGKLMLSTGLVDRAKLTPPEIGVVLAHAVAHALAGRDRALAAARLAALPVSPDPNRRALQLADILVSMALGERHDKEAEREADAIALELMARAGLDPGPTVEAWRKIARAGGATPPGFLSLHATWPGRIDEIEAMIPRVLPLYEQARADLAAQPQPQPQQRPPIRPR